METRTSVHQTMTEEEIKKTICELVVAMQDFRDDLTETLLIFEDSIVEMNNKLNLLKRHFCPEKFMEMKIDTASLINLLIQNNEDSCGLAKTD